MSGDGGEDGALNKGGLGRNFKCLNMRLSVYLPFFTFCLSVCLPFSLSDCLSAYLSVCLCLSVSYSVWVVSISWVLPSPPCSSVWVVAGGREACFPRVCHSSPCSAESAHLYRKDDTARLCVFRLVSMTPVFNNNVTNDFYITATGHTVIVYTWNAQRASPSGVGAPWETLDQPLIGVQLFSVFSDKIMLLRHSNLDSRCVSVIVHVWSPSHSLCPSFLIILFLKIVTVIITVTTQLLITLRHFALVESCVCRSSSC